MTPQEIRDAIEAQTDLHQLRLERNDGAIAAALSVNRFKWKPTEIGCGTVLEALGLAAGNALLDAIFTGADFRYVRPLLEQGRMRLDSAAVRAGLDALQQAGALSAASHSALLALAQTPDPVTTEEVSAALNEISTTAGA